MVLYNELIINNLTFVLRTFINILIGLANSLQVPGEILQILNGKVDQHFLWHFLDLPEALILF